MNIKLLEIRPCYSGRAGSREWSGGRVFGFLPLVMMTCCLGCGSADGVHQLSAEEYADVGPEGGPADAASDAQLPPQDVESDAVAPGDGEATAGPSGFAIVAVSPNHVSFRTGGRVRITGDGLDTVSAVRVGGASATIDLRDADGIEVLVPPHAGGGMVSFELEVAGEWVGWDGFRYDGVTPDVLRFVELPEPVVEAPIDRLLTVGETVWALSEGAITVFEADSAGVLTAVVAASPVTAFDHWCPGDFDGDGTLEVWFGGPDGGVIYERMGEALAVLAQVERSARACAVGDLNADGTDDLVIAAAGEEADSGALVQAWLGGTAGLTPGPEAALSAAPVGLALLDVDGDNTLDALVTSGDGPASLLLGDGNHGFGPAPVGLLPGGMGATAIATADFDGNGFDDVVLSGEVTRLWVADGEGRLVDHSSFAIAPVGASSEVSVADFDIDGAPDVVIATAAGVRLLRNDGEGRLFDYSHVLLSRTTVRQAAFADLDRDGDPDAIGGVDGGAAVLTSWAPRPFVDPDFDGFPSEYDVCPELPDPDQLDTDGDGVGDACSG